MLKLFFLAILFLLLNVIFLVTSILVKKHYNIDADYLSAASTCFAAIVAILLFNDWRDQERFRALESFREQISNSSNKFFKSYYAYVEYVYSEKSQDEFLVRNEIQKFTFEILDAIKDHDKNCQLYRKLLIGFNSHESEILNFHIQNRLEEIRTSYNVFHDELLSLDQDTKKSIETLKAIFRESKFVTTFEKIQSPMHTKIFNFNQSLLRK